jgi:hypothetical protein
MKKVYDAVVVVGEYEDRKTGQTKKQYRTVGAVLQNDEGRLSLKLEMVPLVNFNGWINFYEPREREEKPAPSQREQQHQEPFSDEIPF